MDDCLTEFNEDLSLVQLCRKGVCYELPKSFHWHEDILTSFDDNRFRQMLRVSRSQFHFLLGLIANDEVFQKSPERQFQVELQLAIVLFRLGSSGESASISKIASVFGVGDGGTLIKITQRVFKAFLKLQSQYLYWPDSNERSEIVRETFDELPFCIGYIDGTEIKLAEAPCKNHEAFHSRTRIYSVKVQVVCDRHLKIRHVVTGYCGSTHDAKIFKNCSIFTEKSSYFSGQQYLAGDSAYPLSSIVITPYRSNSRHLDANKRKKFNKRHSKYRVRVEHCFGVLKGRFCSLTELRMRFQNEESHQLCNEWILVCCILHNILLATTEVGDFEETSPLNIDSTESNAVDCETFEIKRQSLYNLMFGGEN